MKIHILYKFKETAWGGGNTFLRTLRAEFIKKGIYEKNPDKADAVIFNSFPFGEEYLFKKVRNLKKRGKTVIHRVDGPVSAIRNKDLEVDRAIFKFNDLFADGTVFQSNWSREENYKLGIKKNNFEAVILNASDPNIFNREGKAPFSKERKTKILASSWSANPRKGFDIYEYLDKNLDFSKYEMDFIGNSPVDFKNIKNKGVVNGSANLAKELKKYDIFITASQKDPCSNSLIEALSCGLPSIGLNDGGHPEIIGQGGEIFEKKEEAIEKIKKVADNYEYYRSNIKFPAMGMTASRYYDFIKKVCSGAGKKANNFGFLQLMLIVWFWKYKNKIGNRIKNLK